MNLKRAEHPFQFWTQVNLIELTGLRARNIRELYGHLKTVPSSVIYFHTHHFLKQHQFLSPEPPNDFAYWVTSVLQEERLGEQLAAIDTVRFSSIKELREKVLEVMERYLETDKRSVIAPNGQEFYLKKSQSFVMPTRYVVNDLSEFLGSVKKISIESLYHHVFSARLRIGKEVNDFSNWLKNELGERELAQAISRLDPYTQTLEGLRGRIIALVDKRLNGPAQENSHAS
jgi:hypothetical protein